MPITEATLISWLSGNWPSVLLGLTAAITYVAAISRLQKFTARIDTTERELLRISHEIACQKAKMARVMIHHCRRHPEDMEQLMKITEDDAA